MIEREERRSITATIIVLIFAVSILTLTGVMTCIEEDNNNSSKVVTSTDNEEIMNDEEMVLEAIVNSLDSDYHTNIISVEEEENEKVIQEYLRKHYNAFRIIINESYYFDVTYKRELLLVHIDEYGIEYKKNVKINIDIPYEERKKDNADDILIGHECQWTVKGATIFKWVLGEKIDSFDIPQGFTLIGDDFGTLWIGEKDENNVVKSLSYFSEEERKSIEVSTSPVMAWEKLENSIFYLDTNKKLWHINLSTGEKEILFTDIEKMSTDWYFVFDEETATYFETYN